MRHYTSDHHFRHRNIGVLCQRPLPMEDMEEVMIQRWNESVAPDDEVFHLGDFSLSPSCLEQIVPRLNGRITLIAGNHEACWAHRTNQVKARNALPRYEAIFATVVPEGTLEHTVDGHPVLLSHLPYHGDSHHDDRYQDLRPTDEGLPVVCGHVHTAWANRYGGDGRTHRGQVHVGVDVWDYRPVSEPTLAALLRNRDTDSQPHRQSARSAEGAAR